MRTTDILRVAALLTCAAAAAAAQSRPRFTIVTIGDSYASGEGAPERHGSYVGPDFRAGAPEIWTLHGDSVERYRARRCHRSPRASSAVVAESLRARYPEVDLAFASFACSGATIVAGALGPYEGAAFELRDDPKLPAQIAQANDHFASDPTRTIDALVVGIGGNDANFADIVRDCLVMPLEWRGCQNNPLTARALSGLAELPTRYARLDSAIDGRGGGPRLRARLRPSVVYAIEYPDPTHGGPPGTGTAANPENFCYRGAARDPLYDNTNPAEARFIREAVVGPLNDRLRDAARRAGWTYVGGVMDDYYTHGLCAADSWFRGNVESLRIQGNDVEAAAGLTVPGLSSGLAHPNEAGQRAIARRLLPLLDAQLRRTLAGATLAVAAPRLTVHAITGAPPTATDAAARAIAARAGAQAAPLRGARASVTLGWTDPVPGGALRHVLEIDGRPHELSGNVTRYTHAAAGRFRFALRACLGLLCSPRSNEIVVSNVVPGVPGGLRQATSPGTATFAGGIPVTWTMDDHAEHVELHYRPTEAGRSAAAFEVVTAASPPGRVGTPGAPLAAGSYEIKARACSRAGCSAFAPSIVASPGAAARSAGEGPP